MESNDMINYVAEELERYQVMTQEVLNYVIEHTDVKEVDEIYNIIKKWAC